MGNKCFVDLTELEDERRLEAEVALQSGVMRGPRPENPRHLEHWRSRPEECQVEDAGCFREQVTVCAVHGTRIMQCEAGHFLCWNCSLEPDVSQLQGELCGPSSGHWGIPQDSEWSGRLWHSDKAETFSAFNMDPNIYKAIFTTVSLNQMYIFRIY